MSNVRYVNSIKVALFKVTKVANDLSLYVGSSLSEFVIAVQQSDGLEIEAVSQSLGPSFEAPVLTLSSGCKRGEQAVARVVVVFDDLFGLPVPSGAVGVLEGR